MSLRRITITIVAPEWERISDLKPFLERILTVFLPHADVEVSEEEEISG
ncbi:hypothetical protein LCGC14_2125480 [marine sediment metagenome]|uniref:Uncharacterized protein n=1 Tax=marine sediment metagenome TaxID=412755 RepID=A0A0F9EQ62_9ZZZZ